MALTLDLQEIWDEIVDHLRGSPEDLKSSALVCRSFTYRAQSHIFRTIKLVPPLIFAARSPDQTLQLSDARTSLVGSPGPSSRPSTTTLARRLRDLMALSSHLIVHVRALHIGRGDEELLASIARIRWSRVHILSLDLASYFHATTASTLNDIKTLVAMPSLRTMVFARAFWDSAHLQNAFDHCNTALEHVRFWHCSPGYTPISTHTPTSNVQSSPRPKISSISLTFSPSVVDLLRHPACGLDFSNLTSMVCSQSFSPAFSSFVRCVGSTISHLYVPGKDRTMEHLDLNVFPALTHIDIDDGPGPVLSRVLSRLAPGNRLGAIRLLLRGNINHVNSQEAEIFESAILGISVPALRRVEVKVRRGPSLVSTPEADLVRTIETALPRLHDRGLIFTVIE